MADLTTVTQHVLARFPRRLVVRPEFAEALAGWPDSRRATPNPEGDGTNARAWRAGVQAAAHIARRLRPAAPAPGRAHTLHIADHDSTTLTEG